MAYSRRESWSARPFTLADVGQQVHEMAKNHVEILDAAGLTPEDIVSGCVYLRDMQDYQGMNAIYQQYYSRGPGVRTCLMPNSGDEIQEVLTGIGPFNIREGTRIIYRCLDAQR
jgi:hypothetical protein